MSIEELMKWLKAIEGKMGAPAPYQTHSSDGYDRLSGLTANPYNDSSQFSLQSLFNSSRPGLMQGYKADAEAWDLPTPKIDELEAMKRKNIHRLKGNL